MAPWMQGGIKGLSGDLELHDAAMLHPRMSGAKKLGSSALWARQGCGGAEIVLAAERCVVHHVSLASSVMRVIKRRYAAIHLALYSVRLQILKSGHSLFILLPAM